VTRTAIVNRRATRRRVAGNPQSAFAKATEDKSAIRCPQTRICAPRSLRDAAEALRGGGVVAFPTETVYGLAVHPGKPAARARLRRVKGRDSRKPFQLLLASRRAAMARCPSMPAAARRLARACWPGPLTLVVRARNGRWVGLRVPDHPVARSLARRCGGALVATSANLSGEPPARTAREALDALGDRVDFVLDGGKTDLGAASSVVRVSEDGWQVLREGAIGKREIAAILGARSMTGRETE